MTDGSAGRGLRVRILGPLRVENRGAPVAVGGPKPRKLLAILVVADGDVVPVDRLIADLWGDVPPAGAAPTLQAYVSRLRGVLGPAARLEHRPPGYRLQLDAGVLDSAEFVDLVRTAGVAAAAGDHAGAVVKLDAALGLWAGAALAEFADDDFARPTTAHLTELRAAAAEDRIDALLEQGSAAVVVPELEAMVRRHPERERATAALMRAYYATGRQADALAAYQDLRGRLEEELGIDPSGATQEMYRRILLQDAALSPRRAPGNLPRRISGFVGRQREIAALRQALRASPLVTLTGVGGAGKTRLAQEVADQERDRFPDGAWWCELAGLPDGGPVGHAIAAALGVRQRTGLTIERTVLEYLRPRSALLVIDNCEHVVAPAAELIAEIVQTCPRVVVLATSRQLLGVEGEQAWPLPPLSLDEGTELFVQRARAAAPDFSVDAMAVSAVAAICARLDGLPLGIELAAARMRVLTPTEVARRLEDAPLLGGGRGALARHQSLTAAIEWSYRLLPVAEQELFRGISAFAGDADLTAVQRVAAPDSSEDAVLERLAGLVDRSMIVAATGGTHSRYGVLDTLRAYGRAQVAAAGGDRALADRHARHFVDLAERAAVGLHGPDEQAWVDQAVPDYDNLRAAFRHARDQGDIDLALRLVAAVPELVHLRIGYEASEWAAGLLDRSPVDHPAYPTAVGFAARGAWNRGDFRSARALARRAVGRTPPVGAARIAHPGDVLADVALPEGDPDLTLRHYAAEADRARSNADPVRLIWCLHCFAVCQTICGAPERGVAAARESVAVAAGTANPSSLAIAGYALGLVLKRVEPERALTLLDEAVEIARSVRNTWWQGVAMMEAAATRAVHDDPRTAARAFVAVLDHWEKVGDRTQQWQNLRYVARLLRRLDAADEATSLTNSLVAAGEQRSIMSRQQRAIAGTADGQTEAVRNARAALVRHT